MPSHAHDPAHVQTVHDRLTQLIQRGRDLEAVQLATEDIVNPTRGVSMDPISQLDAVVPLLDAMVAELEDDELDVPTPCASFNVRQVLEHMVGGATMFAAAFRGTTPGPMEPAEDVRGAFSPAMANLLDAIRSSGALDRLVQAPFGEVPGETFARFVALDGVVHGWDIATATGRGYDPPTLVVEAVEAFAANAITEGLRDGVTFAAAVAAPPGAPALTRLVAFTGRSVG